MIDDHVPTKLRIGGQVKVTRSDKKHWNDVYEGLIEWVDEKEDPPLDVVIVRITKARRENISKPEITRTLEHPHPLLAVFAAEVLVA